MASIRQIGSKVGWEAGVVDTALSHTRPRAQMAGGARHASIGLDDDQTHASQAKA